MQSHLFCTDIWVKIICFWPFAKGKILSGNTSTGSESILLAIWSPIINHVITNIYTLFCWWCRSFIDHFHISSNSLWIQGAFYWQFPCQNSCSLRKNTLCSVSVPGHLTAKTFCTHHKYIFVMHCALFCRVHYTVIWKKIKLNFYWIWILCEKYIIVSQTGLRKQYWHSGEDRDRISCLGQEHSCQLPGDGQSEEWEWGIKGPIAHYCCEKANLLVKKTPMVSRPLSNIVCLMAASYNLCYAVWFMWQCSHIKCQAISNHHADSSQHGDCWWPGIYLVQGHLKPSWSHNAVGIYQEWPM